MRRAQLLAQPPACPARRRPPRSDARRRPRRRAARSCRPRRSRSRRRGRPARTPAVRQTAPVPVATAQPASAAISNGTPSGIGMQHAAGTIVALGEGGEERVVVDRLAGAREPRAVPSSRPPDAISVHAVAQRWLSSRRHSSQCPHAGSQESTTRVPGGQPTPSPTASTTPAPSWPSTAGQRVGGGAVDRVEVGVADAARVQPHQHLARPGRRQVQLRHLQPRSDPLEDGGADLQRSPPGGRSPGVPRRPAGARSRAASRRGLLGRGRRRAAAHPTARCRPPGAYRSPARDCARRDRGPVAVAARARSSASRAAPRPSSGSARSGPARPP